MKFLSWKLLSLKMRIIQNRTWCAHSLEESIYIVQYLLLNSPSGDLAEFGVFKGGMTAKLGLVAKRLGKTLYAYDSYQGLPDPEKYGTGHQVKVYKKKMEDGQSYCGTREEVEHNVSRYGALKNTRFIQGFFSDTFDDPSIQHPVKLGAVFIDVDLSLSLKQCLDFVWPRLTEGGIVFFHEARDPEIVSVIKDSGLLQYEHKGIGDGLEGACRNLGWVKKSKMG